MKTYTMLFVKYYSTIKAIEPIFLNQYNEGSFIPEIEWAPLSAYFGTLMTQL